MEQKERENPEVIGLSNAEYRKYWADLTKIEIRMIEKHGECHHNLEDTFIYDTPYKKPENVCNALLHVLDLYTWRMVFGFPSWNDDDKGVYKIHCPDSTGTVWEMRAIK